MRKWKEKPYHSLDYMLRERFGEKVYKVTLNGGMSCPNRDGKIGTRGCIFCSEGEAATLQRLQASPSQSRLTARLPFFHRNAPLKSISPIFRHIPIPMPLWNILEKFSQRQSPIRKLSLFLLEQDPTVWEMRSYPFCQSLMRESPYG